MESITELTENDVRALERADIITFKGISGVWTMATIAMEAPSLVEVYSSAGAVYDFEKSADGTYSLHPKEA